MGAISKHQHYIPRFYLRGFSKPDNKKRVFILHRENFHDTSLIREVSVSDACVGKCLYEARFENGEFWRLGEIEQGLSKVETKLAPWFRKACELSDDEADLSDVHCILEKLELFLALLMVRHPEWQNDVRSLRDEVCAELLLEMEGGTNPEWERRLTTVVDYSIAELSLFSTDEKSPVEQIRHMLGKMDALILRTPLGSELVTSTFPFAMDWPSSARSDPTALYFPLCKDTGVIFTRPNIRKVGSAKRRIGFFRISTYETIRLNRMLIMKNSFWKYVIGSNKRMLSAFAKGCISVGLMNG